MHLPRFSFIAAAATALILAGTAAASAATAFASTTVNVRAGGGTSYPVVDVLRPGQRVEVEYCKGTWCAISKPGPDGWVNANYLTSGRDYDDRYYDYDDGPDFFIIKPRPRIHYWPYYRNRACVGGPNARFCISN